MEKFYQNIQFKKLDQYDVILDDINLELSEFLEEMANWIVPSRLKNNDYELYRFILYHFKLVQTIYF